MEDKRQRYRGSIVWLCSLGFSMLWYSFFCCRYVVANIMQASILDPSAPPRHKTKCCFLRLLCSFAKRQLSYTNIFVGWASAEAALHARALVDGMVHVLDTEPRLPIAEHVHPYCLGGRGALLTLLMLACTLCFALLSSWRRLVRTRLCWAPTPSPWASRERKGRSPSCSTWPPRPTLVSFQLFFLSFSAFSCYGTVSMNSLKNHLFWKPVKYGV